MKLYPKLFTLAAVLVFHLACVELRQVVNESEYWDINTQKGIMRGQNLRLRKLNHPSNPYHTCYEVHCQNTYSNHCPEDEGSSMIQVCYPAIIITGFPKCGTSAMYDLLSRVPGAVTMHEKENCPFTRRRPHWIYFNSLPRMDALSPRSLIIDGCIDIINNMKIRGLINNPDTYYLVSYVLFELLINTRVFRPIYFNCLRFIH